MGMISLRKRKRTRRGVAAVEAALVLFPVILLILGIMEYSRYVMTIQLFNTAAREGCRYAITHLQPVTIGSTTYGDATSDVTNKINSFLAGQTLSGQSIQIYASDGLGNNIGTWNNASPGQSVCVKITGNYVVTLTTLLHLNSTIPVTAEVAMDVESP